MSDFLYGVIPIAVGLWIVYVLALISMTPVPKIYPQDYGYEED